jgi:hypothetical protein
MKTITRTKKYGGKVVKRAAGGGVALRGHGAVRRI